MIKTMKRDTDINSLMILIVVLVGAIPLICVFASQETGIEWISYIGLIIPTIIIVIGGVLILKSIGIMLYEMIFDTHYPQDKMPKFIDKLRSIKSMSIRQIWNKIVSILGAILFILMIGVFVLLLAMLVMFNLVYGVVVITFVVILFISIFWQHM